MLRHLQDILESRALLFDVLFGVFLGRDGTRPPPAEAQAMERTAKRLRARGGCTLPQKLEGDELATPARAQPAMRGGRVFFEEALDALVRLLGEQRPRAALSAVVEGRVPLDATA